MNAQQNAQQAPAAGLERVDLRLLGPLEALVEGEPVSLGAPKQRVLLARLILYANEAVPVERLVDALWPEDPPPSARHAIQVYVSRLRRALGPERIEARARAYLLRTEADELDLGRFRALVAKAREALSTGDAATAAEHAAAALALWRDRPLADLEGEPGVDELVLELEEERAAALELQIETRLQAGAGGELVGALERLVGEYPSREELHGQLMRALYRAGRQADALAAYERAREALQNELGLEPSPRLQELEAAVRRHDPALRPDLRALGERLHLPAPPNELIGRERELDEVVELVAHGQRLVTLTGTGGIGKTRLALAAAERLAAQFEDGVWFVDLSAVSDPDLVVGEVADALGVNESPEEPLAAALDAHVADKHMLLVVDNFEHVADAAPSVTRLLRSGPQLALLVTSRSPLHVFGEHQYQVRALTLPDLRDELGEIRESEAVQLFLARARAADRHFQLSDQNAPDVSDVCAALGGLPLALELAAARLKEFSPAELRQRLEASLDVLVGGPVDAPARQQTVRDTIAWSYGLLPESERRLFSCLAVFSGGWTADAAAEVCGASTEALASLAEKGLTVATGERFSMLMPIREFARDRLTSAQAKKLARKHAVYFARFAEAADARARAHGRVPKLLDEVGREYENLRAALQWCEDNSESELLARLAGGLGQYWNSRGPYPEARRWLEAALVADVENAHLLGYVAFGLGMVCMRLEDHKAANAAYARALSLFRSVGDQEMQARCLGNLGQAAIWLGDAARAREFLIEGQRVAEELGNQLMLARIANALGVLAQTQERLGEAERWYEQSLTASERARDHEGAAIALINLAWVSLRANRLKDAGLRYRESLRLADELQHSEQVAVCLLGLAEVAVAERTFIRAARLLGASDAIREEVGGELNPSSTSVRNEALAAVRDGIGEEAAAEEYESGKSLRRSEALAYALND